MRKELLIGAGSSRVKKLCMDSRSNWEGLVTLDYNSDHKPDVVWDLEKLPLPFEADTFDELHAYEVLEHTGSLGDAKFFFDQFSDFWRILKPDGLIIGTCPSRTSAWAFGDPSHKRVIQPESFIFLTQPEYTRQVGITAMSDFRNIYKADFDHVWMKDNGETFTFVLKAVKPSRISI